MGPVFADVSYWIAGLNERDSFHEIAVLFRDVVNFYDARPDQEWGLADCASFQMMAERNIREALTNDHHFTQAGFNILMQ